VRSHDDTIMPLASSLKPAQPRPSGDSAPNRCTELHYEVPQHASRPSIDDPSPRRALERTAVLGMLLFRALKMEGCKRARKHQDALGKVSLAPQLHHVPLPHCPGVAQNSKQASTRAQPFGQGNKKPPHQKPPQDQSPGPPNLQTTTAPNPQSTLDIPRIKGGAQRGAGGG